MRDARKHLGWSVLCLASVWLTANAADAATLGTGQGWQASWETVTSGGLALSVNATGGASKAWFKGPYPAAGLPLVITLFQEESSNP